MSWAKPACSNNDLYRAGKEIANAGTWSESGIKTVDAWRLAHALPLAIIQSALHKDCGSLGFTEKALLTGRLKRMASIRSKILRGDIRDLSGMQDFAGCRVVLPTVSDVQTLRAHFKNRGCKIREYDYIANPRPTGYRGIHLAVTYQGRNRHEYDGLKIEIQLRTRLQHRWSTAVETFTFLERFGDLKSGRGNPDWQAFLALMSEAYAIAEQAPGDQLGIDLPDDLKERAADYQKQLKVDQMLTGIGTAVMVTSALGNPIRFDMAFLIDQQNNNVDVHAYPLGNFDTANSDYLRAESMGHNAVLVFAVDINALRQGYPSYFSDITMFRKDAMGVAFEKPWRLERP
jgi:hypothetical protein